MKLSHAIWLVLVSLLSDEAGAKSWKFGLIGDTQWPYNPYYDSLGGFRNPNGVAVDILRQIDKEFIAHGVKFVIAVGDLSDFSTNEAYHTRATWAQPLYDAGIGFFPLRGNHDDVTEPTNASEFVRVFPQTRDGEMNRTPLDAFDWTDSATLHPTFTTTDRQTFPVGSKFSSPRPSLTGLSYAFSYDNATFVLLDQFRTTDPLETNTIVSQIPWIDSALRNRPRPSHAFVLGHKGIVTENHADNLFGGSPAVDSAGTNKFLRSLAGNEVRWYIGGHDHLHNRSLITATNDTAVRVQGIILPSASYKSYAPYYPSIDSLYDLPAFGRTRQIQLSQDLYRLGFTIVTIDGPLVTAEYWATPVMENGQPLDSIPDLTGQWSLRETYGYSTNGRQFLVAQGGSYAVVHDTGFGTSLRILGGTNTDRTTDHTDRHFRQEVSIGWKDVPEMSSASATIWGMRLAQGSEQTPPFALSLSYDKSKTDPRDLLAGHCVLLRSHEGAWRNAVVANTAGSPLFVLRPWVSSDPLGTYGIDTTTGTAWAVVNRAGTFAVGRDPVLPPRRDRVTPRFSHRTILFPTHWNGQGVTVRVRSTDGRLAITRHTADRSLDLGEVGRGIFAVQAAAEQGQEWNGLVYMP
ncbi:MAG: metallophosphoesterase [Fibrobacterota bacterium]